MFTRKPKTVAAVIANFLNVIEDLDQIVLDNMALASALETQRVQIEEKIDVADNEVAQARGISDRLTNLCGIEAPE